MTTSTDATEAVLQKIFAPLEPEPCPLCCQPLDPKPVRNALSRYDKDTYICTDCGHVEALRLGNMNRVSGKPREVLYYDGTGPIMLVTEDEAGYTEAFGHPADKTDDERAWLKFYVEAVNTRHGFASDQVSDIVASSMFAQGIL